MTEKQAPYNASAKAKPNREDMFAAQLADFGLTGYVRNYRFHPVRRWEFDFAWIAERVAVEIQGGTWVRGSHGRGGGIRRDAIKLAEANLLGWQLFFVTSDMVRDGSGLMYVRMALKAKRENGH